MQPLLARAKVNLALHVTGQRADGYHLLDSLVVFPETGDRLTGEPAGALSLTIAGPFGAGLSADRDNLVLRSADALAKKAREDGHAIAGAALRLEKALPVASGIGGGSADAAATLWVLTRLWELPYGVAELEALALDIGADVPMCLHDCPLRVSGIGEMLQPAPGLPAFSLVLVNPGVAVSTPAVFRALTRRENPPLPPLPAAIDGAAGLATWLMSCRNDLEAPARSLEPVIGDVLASLGQAEACLLARMSGSGATCFGLFAGDVEAEQAATAIAAAHPDWWVRSAPVWPASVRPRTSPWND